MITGVATVSNSTENRSPVRIEFTPKRTKHSNGTYTRALVDSDEPEWIELVTYTKDTTLGCEDGGDIDNPMG
uniref:hypothetical protein n=1 Tax=uncultured Bacteroides sp. TaxID=162156 RepID=UPI0025CDD2EE|nr:hypothetical protein [uncultured Bacteroides sp.]